MCTSTTATPTQMPRITPQFSRSHFSTKVMQPYKKKKKVRKQVKESQMDVWGDKGVVSSQPDEHGDF